MAQFRGFSSVAQILAGPISANPGSITNSTVLELSLTVPGAEPGMFFLVAAPDLESDLVISGNPICATAGTVIVRIANISAAPINPAEQDFYVMGL